MAVFSFWSFSPPVKSETVDQKLEDHVSSNEADPTEQPTAPPASTEVASIVKPSSPKDIPLPASPSVTNGDSHDSTEAKLRTPNGRGLASRSFYFLYGNKSRYHEEHSPVISTQEDHEKKARAAAAFSRSFTRRALPNADKRAKESALIVRSLIVGPSSISTTSPKTSRTVLKPQLKKIKAQLMQPKSANRVIAQLRALPVSDLPPTSQGKLEDGGKADATKGPIHAVCLEYCDTEMQDRHFSRLEHIEQETFGTSEFIDFPSVATATIEAVTSMLNDMHVVSLIMQPDFGFGQPGDGEGILAGAVPTAETIINGVEQITPQLMALGYATGKAMVPDHTGVYPPTDRISVLTYWWGLEVVLPPPTLGYLSRTQSITNSVINFLSALALINNGVREILPFVRYIAQFIDFEFKAIKQQDKGKGVVCAATWIMPAAMVPRPWDFPPPPPPKSSSEGEAEPFAENPATVIPSSPKTSESAPPSDSDHSHDDTPQPDPIPALPPVLPEVDVSTSPRDNASPVNAADSPSPVPNIV